MIKSINMSAFSKKQRKADSQTENEIDEEEFLECKSYFSKS